MLGNSCLKESALAATIKVKIFQERLGDVPGPAALASGQLMDAEPTSRAAERRIIKFGGEDCLIAAGVKFKQH
jgi:hypothetical protein